MEYLNLLKEINKKIMNGFTDIRMSKYNDIICGKLDKFFSNTFDLDKFLILCTVLYNYQIFYDGNTRTMFIFMNLILNKYDYYIDIDSIKNKYKEMRCYFPILYDVENDILTNDDLNKMKEFIYESRKVIR